MHTAAAITACTAIVHMLPLCICCHCAYAAIVHILPYTAVAAADARPATSLHGSLADALLPTVNHHV